MRSAFRQIKGSIPSFSRGNPCDHPDRQGSSRMSKIKMRCTTCGKWFQSANAKEVTCPDCVQKARKEKLAAKTAPPSSSIKTPGQIGQGAASPSRPSPPKPKQSSRGTSHWFVSVGDEKVSQRRPQPIPK